MKVIVRPLVAAADRGRRLVVFKWATREYSFLTEDWDRSPSSIVWSKDGNMLYLTVEEYGKLKLFELPFRKTASSNLGPFPKPVVTEHSLIAVHHAGNDLLLSQTSLTEPSIVQLYDTTSKSLHPVVTAWNSNPLSQKSVQEFWFEGYQRHPVHGFMYLPESFSPKKKYPLAFLIHGGPQMAWEDAWSTRWNPAVFANHGNGWVVVAINPSGSSGYGMEFQDAITGNWGTNPCMAQVYFG